MKTYNVWKSLLTNEIYKMDVDWLPKYDGWVLLATIQA